MTAGDGLMILPFELARVLDVVLDPGRKQLADVIARHPELRQWLAEFDAVVPPRPVQPPIRAETVWVPTAQAAQMLGVSDRRVRQMKKKLRHEKHGNVLVFALADLEQERAARAA